MDMKIARNVAGMMNQSNRLADRINKLLDKKEKIDGRIKKTQDNCDHRMHSDGKGPICVVCGYQPPVEMSDAAKAGIAAATKSPEAPAAAPPAVPAENPLVPVLDEVGDQIEELMNDIDDNKMDLPTLHERLNSLLGVIEEAAHPTPEEPHPCTCKSSPPGMVSEVDPRRCAYCGGLFELNQKAQKAPTGPGKDGDPKTPEAPPEAPKTA